MTIINNRKIIHVLFGLALFCVSGCLPWQVESEYTAEVGDPQISCVNASQLMVDFPASPYFTEDPPDLRIQSSETTVSPSTVTNSLVYFIPSPPVDKKETLQLLSSEARQFRVTLPSCDALDHSPAEVERKPKIITGGIIHSCDGDVLVVSFEFDQPVSGDIKFQWFDDERISGSAKSVTVAALLDTEVSFRLVDAYAQAGVYNIRTPDLGFSGPEGFNVIYRSSATWQWGTCALTDELLAPDRTPRIINAMCVGKGTPKQLMIVFEFEQDVMGQYELFVNEVQYKQETVAPARRHSSNKE